VKALPIADCRLPIGVVGDLGSTALVSTGNEGIEDLNKSAIGNRQSAIDWHEG